MRIYLMKDRTGSEHSGHDWGRMDWWSAWGAAIPDQKAVERMRAQWPESRGALATLWWSWLSRSQQAFRLHNATHRPVMLVPRGMSAAEIGNQIGDDRAVNLDELKLAGPVLTRGEFRVLVNGKAVLFVDCGKWDEDMGDDVVPLRAWRVFAIDPQSEEGARDITRELVDWVGEAGGDARFDEEEDAGGKGWLVGNARGICGCFYELSNFLERETGASVHRVQA
jgi:hypothetical protein